MEPTEGLIATPAAVTARRATAREGERSDRFRWRISRDNEWRWAPTRIVL